MLSNTQFSMAVHVLSALAYNDGRVVASEDLARTVGTNSSYLRGLIGQLKEAGLVETQLGKGGGTLLARAPSTITLADIYRAVETGPAVKTHSCDAGSVCPVAQGMDRVLNEVTRRVEKAVGEELQRVTVATLVEDFIGQRK